jgi:uncharacterized protein
MQTDATSSAAGQTRFGSVVALWRYPVKSMMGEELNSCEVTDRGLLGDRQFAVVDRATGKVGGAKNPRRWGNFFDFRAASAEAPNLGGRISPVRITLPDGEVVGNDRADLEQILSHAFGRDIAFVEARAEGMTSGVAEEYWPDIAGLEHRDTVTDFEMPAGTFFDIAVVHLLTTSTIDCLRELYPQGRFEAHRFRPNIVVSTGSEDAGFVESDWIGRTVVISDTVRLAITEPCPRCVMITLPQGDLPNDSGSSVRPLNSTESTSASTPRLSMAGPSAAATRSCWPEMGLTRPCRGLLEIFVTQSMQHRID